MIYNKIPSPFESKETVCYALADVKGTILTFECPLGRYLILFQGIDLPTDAEDIVKYRMGLRLRAQMGAALDEGLSFVMILQCMIDDMIHGTEELIGYEVYSADPEEIPLIYTKYPYLPKNE